MVGRPAARVLDPVIHPLPGVLTPGPGSFNVIIGKKPAWRGVPAAAAAALQSAKATSNATLAAAKAAKVAAAGTPGAPAAIAAEETAKATAAAAMSLMVTSMAGGADIHICATPLLPPPPHGPGVVIDGSPTVLINGLPACRQMDTILEAFGPPNKIAMGLLNVLIGNGKSIILEGTPAEQQQLAEMIETIRNSGPDGKAFIESLENSPNPTRLFIGTSATQADGTVISLAATGGGVTIRPSDSVTGANEVYVDPTNLINYNTTAGGRAAETQEGLLMHEMGHAALLNSGDPAQTTGGPNAERNVRTLTNPVRSDMGIPGDAG